MRLATFVSGDCVVVSVDGEVCAADAFLFEGFLLAALARGRGCVVVDLTAASYFDVLALAVLVKTRGRLSTGAGRGLRIVIGNGAANAYDTFGGDRWQVYRTLAAATHQFPHQTVRTASAPWAAVRSAAPNGLTD
jgi:anti-anti-sigma factor